MSKLTSVFFNNNGHTVRAIVPVSELKFFFDLGASREPGAKPEQYAPEGGDVGSGPVGSLIWHKTHIAGMRTKKDVAEYVKHVTDGQKIDIDGKLLTVIKEEAIEVINGQNSGSDNGRA